MQSLAAQLINGLDSGLSLNIGGLGADSIGRSPRTPYAGLIKGETVPSRFPTGPLDCNGILLEFDLTVGLGFSGKTELLDPIWASLSLISCDVTAPSSNVGG